MNQGRSPRIFRFIRFIALLIVAVTLLKIGPQLATASQPTITFLQKQLYSSDAYGTGGIKLNVSVNEFIAQLPNGSWEQADSQSWIYRFSVPDFVTKRLSNYALVFIDEPPPQYAPPASVIFAREVLNDNDLSPGMVYVNASEIAQRAIAARSKTH